MRVQLTPAQCLKARNLLRWSQRQLSEASGVAADSISKFECRRRKPQPVTIDSLGTALEAAGVEFTNDEPGVRMKAK